jgi:hypothetical protein
MMTVNGSWFEPRFGLDEAFDLVEDLRVVVGSREGLISVTGPVPCVHNMPFSWHAVTADDASIGYSVIGVSRI